MSSLFTDAQIRLLDAAWSLVTQRRRADFTTTELARTVGISRQAVYFHFPNRASLLDAMLSRFYESHVNGAAPDRPRDVTASKEFEASLRGWLDDVRRVFPVAYALEIATTGKLASDEWCEEWIGWCEEWIGWRDSLRDSVERLAGHAGLAKGWSVDEAADWMWARTGPSVWQCLVDECGWTPAHLVKRLVSSIMAEVVAPGASTVMVLDPRRRRRRPASRDTKQAK
jgi:AcrR family transcriptional regulator